MLACQNGQIQHMQNSIPYETRQWFVPSKEVRQCAVHQALNQIILGAHWEGWLREGSGYYNGLIFWGLRSTGD